LTPNVSEYRLREHAGWSKRSDMVEIYTHTLTGDSAEDILMLYGVNLKGGKKKRNERLQQEMVGPHCPFCHSVNVPGTTQLCTSCHRPISTVPYDTIIREAENLRKELVELKAQQQSQIDRQKKFEEEFIERMQEEREANLETLQHEILRLSESQLKKIKNPKERDNEREVLLMNADVLDEYDIE
jgi:hypothetical protein